MAVGEGMSPSETYFTGHDGLPLFDRSWMPTGRPRATVVFIHGLIEHSGCHAGMACQLVRQGFSVHAMDLRGHGRSEGPRCDVRSFDDYLLDLDVFFQRVSAGTMYPLSAGSRPLFLIGNSMGGLVVTLWAILRQPRIRGLILSGPLLALADGLYPWLRHFAAAGAAVAPTLRVARISFEQLSRVRQVVDRLRDDPLMFQGRFTVRMAAEILRAMKIASKKARSLSVPLLILHGSRDQVCDTAGSLALYQNASCPDKTFRLYEGFDHEVFEEPERDRVLADLTAWLDQHVPETDAAVCRKQAEV